MSFSAEEKTISKLLNNTIYEIPRNQRKYVWEKENWEDLFEDTSFSRNKEAHFLGSIILKEEKSKQGLGYFTIIDGQQRILTLTVFLSTIMLHFKRLGLFDDFNRTTKHLQVKDNKNNSVLIFDSGYHSSLRHLILSVLN